MKSWKEMSAQEMKDLDAKFRVAEALLKECGYRRGGSTVVARENQTKTNFGVFYHLYRHDGFSARLTDTIALNLLTVDEIIQDLEALKQSEAEIAFMMMS